MMTDTGKTADGRHFDMETFFIDVAKKMSLPGFGPKAIPDTDYKSLVGHVTWKGGKQNPVKNVCTTPLVGGQWKKGTKFPYDLHIVYNGSAPDIPVDSPFEVIKYA